MTTGFGGIVVVVEEGPGPMRGGAWSIGSSTGISYCCTQNNYRYGYAFGTKTTQTSKRIFLGMSFSLKNCTASSPIRRTLSLKSKIHCRWLLAIGSTVMHKIYVPGASLTYPVPSRDRFLGCLARW